MTSSSLSVALLEVFDRAPQRAFAELCNARAEEGKAAFPVSHGACKEGKPLSLSSAAPGKEGKRLSLFAMRR